MPVFPGDSYRKPQPGDRLTIPARLWGEVIDTVRTVKGQETGGDFLGSPGAAQTVLKVRNDSGDDRERLDVLGIDVPLILPSESDQEFFYRPVLSGVTPTADHVDRFCILLQPLTAGEIGRAVFAGVAVARVTVDTETEAYRFALAEVDNTSSLVLASRGVEVLYRESGSSGTVNALIRFGGSGGTGGTVGDLDGSSLGPGGELTTGGTSSNPALVTMGPGTEATLSGTLTNPSTLTVGPNGGLVLDGTETEPTLFVLPLWPPLAPQDGAVWVAGGDLVFVDANGQQNTLRPANLPTTPEPWSVWWAGAPVPNPPDPDLPPVPEWRNDPIIKGLILKGVNLDTNNITIRADAPDSNILYFLPNVAPTANPSYLGWQGEVDGTGFNLLKWLEPETAPPAAGTPVSRWQKFTLPYDLWFDPLPGGTNVDRSILIYTLGAFEVIEDVIAKHSEQFTGSPAPITFGVGLDAPGASGSDYFARDLTVSDAPSNSSSGFITYNSVGSPSTAGSVKITFNSTDTKILGRLQATGFGGSLALLDGGSVDVWLKITDLSGQNVLEGIDGGTF